MDVSATYKYVLYGGNNPAVIQEALAKRKVWSQIPQEKLLLANFIWKPLNYASTVYENFNEIMRYDKNRSVLLNHFQNNSMICTKSGLVRSLKHYYSHDNAIYQQNYHVFETIPTTFIVNTSKDCQQMKDFLERFQQLEEKNFLRQKVPSKHCEKNIWYVKPESLNQGRGISLSNNLKDIESIIYSKVTATNYIIQKAIQRPLLYHKRKFDVRVWALVTGSLDIYFYKTPYIRTSSYQYDDSIFDQFIHLTNNCQQKHFSEYSKYQQGNTVPFSNLKNILSELGKADPEDLMNKVMDRMKSLVVDCILSVRKFFLRNVKKKEFQLFGFDFLIDQDLRTWLLEVNNNPYLGVPNKFIKQMLSQMINEMFEIVLDPIFPPVDYRPVEIKNYELLHKQISFYRINPVRSNSTQNKRKDYYPMQDFSGNFSRDIAQGSKSRRNSEAVNLSSFNNTEKSMKIRYSTPVESLKYLLDTYCFSDLQPFIVPVNFIMSSPRLEERESLQSNIKNLKLITQTRICHILLQPKFILICKKILQSETHFQQVKSTVLNGYTNAIRNHKNRIAVIKNIVPTINKMMKMHNRTYEPKQEIPEDKLVEAIIGLLIKLGGNINRKIFIPGQSRQKQSSRQFFISSNTLKLLINFKESFPNLCTKEIEQFFSNLSEKDWELFDSIEKGEQNISQVSFQQKNVERIEKRIIQNGNYLEDRQYKSQSQNQRGMSKITNISTLPKIKK